ncbi:hypothetical protein [Methylomonas koyamae]
MRELVARLGKGLRADMTGQIRLIGEMGKKSVEFVLNAGFEAGNQADQQHGKGQFARSDKGVIVKTGLFEQLGGMEMADKTNQNTKVLRSTF